MVLPTKPPVWVRFLLLLLWLLPPHYMILILVLLLLLDRLPTKMIIIHTGVQIMDAHSYHLLPFINKLR
jgi:hypothetical protein